MQRILKLVIAICVPAVMVGNAAAYVYPGRPNCPWANPNHTWSRYLNQEYGDKEPFFSIHFSRHIGDIEGGQCYTISYLGNDNWAGVGKIRTIKQHTSKAETRNGGNPTKYEINVWGARFTYNEAGEVFYVGDGQPAGQMYCHIGSECWR